MAGDIWVVAELMNGEVEGVTFEMLDEGRKIANRLQSQLVAVVLGHKLPDVATTLANYGADFIYLVDNHLLAQYTTDAYACALTSLITERKPFLVLQAATANGCDLAPRLAARLGASLASDCIMVQVSPDGAIEATRPTHNDKVYTTFRLTSSPPLLVTLRPGVVGFGRPDFARKAKVESVSVEVDHTSLRTRSMKTYKTDPSSIDLSDAEIVVAGGRGLACSENWHLIEDLAEALGGCVAGSRMAVDAGWVSREKLIGQTGRLVSPKAYLAVGISGAREHVAGILETKGVVAINKDPGAPIFKIAEKKVVGDLNEVVPILIRKLKRLRQDEASKQKDSGGGGA